MNFATYPSLAGRTVFVSGGATGIGADIVRAFALNHAKVAFVDLEAEAGKALAADIAGMGETALFVRCDVTDIKALQEVIADAGARLGPVAVLVNNAANDERHRVGEVTPDYWDHAQNVNLRHHFFAAQAIHPQMRALARAFGDDNIRVNAIEPGAVMTERQRRLWYKTPGAAEAIVKRQLIKTTLIGEDVARMALFLGADDSRMITKQSIAVDAGLR